jgi:hypothetical protein
VTLCGTGEEGASTRIGMVLRENLEGAFDNVIAAGFDIGVDVRDPFGTEADPNVTIVNSLLFANTANPSNDEKETGDDDNDSGFDEDAYFGDVESNSTEDADWSVADCIASGGPKDSVTGSGEGAFADGDWMTGAWIDWQED